MITHGPQSSPDRTRERGILRNGVYEMVTVAADTVRHRTTSARSNIAKLPTALHNTFNHAPAEALRRLTKHYPDTTANLKTLHQPELED
jgi:hypothetical protein